MNIFTSATLSWFSDACCDVRFLDEWDKEPINVQLKHLADARWQEYRFEEQLVLDAQVLLFEEAANLLRKNQFFPNRVMSQISDADLEKRPLAVGDRIVQRVHLIQFGKFHILDIIGLTEVVEMVDEPKRKGFTQITVTPHPQPAIASFMLEQRNRQLFLQISITYYLKKAEHSKRKTYIQQQYRKAVRHGIAHFQHLLT